MPRFVSPWARCRSTSTSRRLRPPGMRRPGRCGRLQPPSVRDGTEPFERIARRFEADHGTFLIAERSAGQSDPLVDPSRSRRARRVPATGPRHAGRRRPRHVGRHSPGGPRRPRSPQSRRGAASAATPARRTSSSAAARAPSRSSFAMATTTSASRSGARASPLGVSSSARSSMACAAPARPWATRSSARPASGRRPQPAAAR